VIHSVNHLYRGSVKNVLGPVIVAGASKADAAVFEYTDSFSVFDWGKMPDALNRKGQALAVLAAHWFEKLGSADAWKEFSRSTQALGLRKASRFGSLFNEIGEQLQAQGLQTHYLGVLPSAVEVGSTIKPQPLNSLTTPASHMAVQLVSVVRPAVTSVLGRNLSDYHPTRQAPAPRLIPLEVVFRFSCPQGSSLLERVKRDPGYLAAIGFAEWKLEEGAQSWDFPVIELFTKLESTDRPVGLSEALAISGLSAPQLQEMLLKTAWAAGFIKWLCAKGGLELADGKLEWALTENGQCMLVDAIGPDELRLLHRNAGSEIQLSKEFLRSFYRASKWYSDTEHAKLQAKARGQTDWKKFVSNPPPALPPLYLEIATQLYWVLTNTLTGRPWFNQAWSLAQLADSIQKFCAEGEFQ